MPSTVRTMWPISPRVENMRVEHGHKGTLLFTFVDQVEHVAGVAAEPVEACHHQFITGTEEV